MENQDWLTSCRTWCKQAKYVSDEIIWSEKPNHSGWLMATSALLDGNRSTIPFLFFKGEYQRGRLYDKAAYALMHRQGEETRRVFMLEIHPRHVRSHKERGIEFFGPHCHLGDYRHTQITKGVITRLDLPHLQDWVERFRRHARIYNNDKRTLRAPPPTLL